MRRACVLLIIHQGSHYTHLIAVLRISSECREPASVDASSDVPNAEEKIIRLGKGDKKDKEREGDLVLRWLSDVQADGLTRVGMLERFCPGPELGSQVRDENKRG